MKRLLHLYLFFFSLSLHAQEETNHWYFCKGVTMDFSTDPPIIGGTKSYLAEGSAAISDPVTGELLFCSNGEMVLDANYNIMPNGSGIMGSWSSTESSLILPKPGSPGQYYLFTTDNFEDPSHQGLRYSIVDMSLNGGLGDVTAAKNVLLSLATAEELSATRDNSCDGWWVMTKEADNNVFQAFHITTAGISAPVTTISGYPHTGWWAGQSCFSPDGTKYAICYHNTSAQHLFDFDKTTGTLSNQVTLSYDTLVQDSRYSLAFSADGTKLYTIIPNIYGYKLYQYDLNVSPYSLYYLGNLPEIGQMHLAKNHKIYLTCGTQLSVINFPNQPGTACDFQLYVHPLPPMYYDNWGTLIGSCHFPSSFYNHFNPCDTSFGVFVHGKNVNCFGENNGMACVEVNNNLGPCTILWSPTGSTNDTIFDLGPGIHTVTVTDPAGHFFTDTVIITAPAAPLSVTLTAFPNDTLCPGDTVTLVATTTGGTPFYAYTWDEFVWIQDDTAAVVFYEPGGATVHVYDNNGCSVEQYIPIHYQPTPTVAASDDIYFCTGDLVTVSASGTPAYQWSTGDTGTVITLVPLGDTIISVSYSDGICSSTDTVHLYSLPGTHVSISSDTDSLCYGDTLTITALVQQGPQPVTIVWSAGFAVNDTVQALVATSTGSVMVFTSSIYCSHSDTIDFYVYPEVFYNLPQDTCLCKGQSLIIDVGPSPVNWNNGVFASQITITPDSAEIYIASATTGVCSKTDTLEVCVRPLPDLDVQAGQQQGHIYGIPLYATGQGDFTWTPTASLSCSDCPNPMAMPFETTLYTVVVSDTYGCSNSAEIKVDYFFSIPNVITPNGDGTNDVFSITGLPALSELHLFNRWGNEVFVSTNYQNDWNTAVDGVYYYTLVTVGGKTFNGFVHVTGNK